MSITFFSLPKANIDPYDRIQSNAVWSWSQVPNSRIILFGDEVGVDNLCRESNSITRVTHVVRNQFGTPLLNDMFYNVTQIADTQWVAYVNADIIVPPHLLSVVEEVISQLPLPVVMVSRRWNIDLPTQLSKDRSDWMDKLIEDVGCNRVLYSTAGMDLFVFPKGFYDHMPPFSIGWPGAKYDNWLVWDAIRRGVPVIEITDSIHLFHQNHPVFKGEDQPEKMAEHRINLALLGGYGYCYDIRDTTHYTDHNGVVYPRQSGLPMGVKMKRRIQRMVDAIRFRGERG